MRITVVLAVGIFILNSSHAQTKDRDKWVKRTKRAEVLFEQGKYVRAESKMKRMMRRHEKREKAPELIGGTAALYAKYLDAQGLAAEAFDIQNKYLELKSDIPDTLGSELVYRLNLYKAGYYLQIEHTREAEMYLDSAEAAITAELSPDSFLVQDVMMKRAKLLRQRAQYSETEEFLKELIALSERKARPKVRRYSGDTAVTDVKLKRRTLKKQRNKLAQARVKLAQLYLETGNINAADSLYRDNQIVFERLIPRRFLPRIQNDAELIYVKYLTSEYSENKAARKLKRERRRFANRMRYGMPNQYYYKLLGLELDLYQKAGKFAKLNKKSSQYRREALKAFGSDNYHFWVARRFNLNKKIGKEKFYSSLSESSYLQEEIERVLPSVHPVHIGFNAQHAKINRFLFNYSAADKMHKKNIGLAQRLYGTESPKYGKFLLNYAVFNSRNLNNYDKAGELFEQAFEMYVFPELHPFHDDYIRYLNEYAHYYAEIDKFDSAHHFLDKGKRIAGEKYGSKSSEYGYQLTLKAGIYIKEGEYVRAEAVLSEAVASIEDAGENRSFEYVQALQTLGELYNLNGRPELAESTLKKAYRISSRLSEHEKQTSFKSNEDLASTYINAGRYDDARNILDKAIKMKTEKFGAEDYKLHEAYLLSGELNLITGDYIAAERDTRKALNTIGDDENNPGSKYLETSILLGDIYTGMANYSEARDKYDYALRSWKRKFGINHIKNAEILIKKAKMELTDPESESDVAALLDSAARIIEISLHDKHPQYAEAIELKGRVLIEENKFEEALQLLSRAEEIYTTTYGERHIKTADNKNIVADLYYRKGEYDEAQRNYSAALKAYKKIFDKYHPKYVGTLGKIGQTHYVTGNYKDAWKDLDETTDIYLSYIERFFPALSEKEKAKYWSGIRSDFEIFNSLAVHYGAEKKKVLRKMYSNRLATKALLLNSSVKMKQQILNSSDPELISLFYKWQTKRDLLSSGISMTEAERSVNEININKLEREINQLEKSLSERTGIFKTRQPTDVPSWRKVRRKLDDHEAVVEIIRFNYFNKKFTDSVLYAALIITPETRHTPDLVVLPNGKELEDRYFKYYRNTIKYKTEDKHSYEQFWAPLDEKLGKATTVYFSPDGIYNQLNPETFYDNGMFLIDKYDFVQVSNSKEVVEYKDHRGDEVEEPENTAVLFGNPAFSFSPEASEEYADNSSTTSRGSGNKVSSVAPLPGAEKEVREIKDFLDLSGWKTGKYLNENATEAMVKSVKSPRVFHVATHGFFYDEQTLEGADNTNEIVEEYENPLLKSGLLFTGAEPLLNTGNIYDLNRADGVLTAFEAMNLSLDNTELVILSACETGLGEIQAGEGVFGLQRAFRVAGAQSIIMTLFKVDDDATQKLMSIFYRKWLESGDKRRAFIEAKQQIKSEYDSPIYWGSFVMMGIE